MQRFFLTLSWRLLKQLLSWSYKTDFYIVTILPSYKSNLWYLLKVRIHKSSLQKCQNFIHMNRKRVAPCGIYNSVTSSINIGFTSLMIIWRYAYPLFLAKVIIFLIYGNPLQKYFFIKNLWNKATNESSPGINFWSH